MREILFRGKRADNGEWVEGYYVKIPEPYTGKVKHIIIPLTTALWHVTEGLSVHEDVIPETVGQWTGLTDKAGKKIFEGDICNETVLSEEKSLTIEYLSASYYFKYIDDPYHCMTPLDDNEFGLEGSWLAVIGNIHDNPELLEANKK